MLEEARGKEMDIDGSCQLDRYPAQGILAITSDELLKIFGLLPQHERCRVIPRLCKSFAGALRQSGMPTPSSFHTLMLMNVVPCLHTGLRFAT